MIDLCVNVFLSSALMCEMPWSGLMFAPAVPCTSKLYVVPSSACLQCNRLLASDECS